MSLKVAKGYSHLHGISFLLWPTCPVTFATAKMTGKVMTGAISDLFSVLNLTTLLDFLRDDWPLNKLAKKKSVFENNQLYNWNESAL